MDCSIDMQMICEEQLNKSKACCSVEFKGTIYLIDLTAMTQLNTYKGSLRKLRRQSLDQLQDGCIKLELEERDFWSERASKMRRKF